MTLIDSLRFVQGAVAKKDFVPSLTHFRIKDRIVIGFNGTLGISSPIDLDLNVAPRAVDLIKAIAACQETISLHVADNGKLVVQSGSLRSFVNCDTSDSFPDIKPHGQFVQLNDSLLPALRHLEPFIATDASRPWACSILLDGESAFATNNIVLVEFWLGFKFPIRVNIPVAVVRELIRINEDPVRLQMSERGLTFHFSDGRWISTRLLDSPWPDVSGLLNKKGSGQQEPIPPGLWLALEQMLPFCDELNRCFFLGDRMTTVADDSAAGTSIALTCPHKGVYNAKQLLNLKEIARTIAFDSYPDSVVFYGDRCRGLIAPLRQ